MTVELDKSSPAVRMAYAGAIGVLADVADRVRGDDRVSIVRAIDDWCGFSGWSYEDDGTGKIDLLQP